MRKSGNFGRTLNSGDKEGASSTRVDLTQHQRIASGGNPDSSKRQLFGGKDADKKAKKSDSESYEASYGYDDEVSYYSDDQEDEPDGQKEKMEFDDGNEYSPGKMLPVDLLNPPVNNDKYDRPARDTKIVDKKKSSTLVASKTIEASDMKYGGKDSKYSTINDAPP